MLLDDQTPPLTSTFEFETIWVDARGNLSKRDRTQASSFTELLSGSIALDMVQIPAGIGQMGSPILEEGHCDDEALHSIQLPSFFMSKYLITQAQWRAVAALPKIEQSLNSDPAHFKGMNRPVEQVSWEEAIEFCARLSHATGRSYRLPTEAEWEYACRAGTTTPFHFGETLSTDWANYCGEDHYGKQRAQKNILYKGSYGRGMTGIDRKATTEVGHFQAANAFGLYDMHGNVWEWCAHDSVQQDRAATQPLRGGSWQSSPDACRAASRTTLGLSRRKEVVGFRVVYFLNDHRAIGAGRSPKEIAQVSSPLSSQIILSNSSIDGNVTIGNVTQNYTVIHKNVYPPSMQTHSPHNPIRTILFLASSPTNQARLRQDQEVREINLGLERAKYREQLKLEQRSAVRPIDLRRALLSIEPEILHFSGHGDGEVGLVLEDQLGSSKLVAADELASLFELFEGLECVVLNACYSDVQASAIVQHVPYVIGMSHAIHDKAAIEFAIGFYDALGAGWSYEKAFEMGKRAIALEGIPGTLIPVLRKRTDWRS